MPLYRNAVSASNYMRQRNETINRFIKKLFTASGVPVNDFTASNLRLASNFYRRLVVQRAMYSLGKGISFVDVTESGEDITKAALGPRFDDDVKKIGINAIAHGVSFPFWNMDHVDVFDATEFAPIWDERSGALVAGINDCLCIYNTCCTLRCNHVVCLYNQLSIVIIHILTCKTSGNTFF